MLLPLIVTALLVAGMIVRGLVRAEHHRNLVRRLQPRVTAPTTGSAAREGIETSSEKAQLELYEGRYRIRETGEVVVFFAQDGHLIARQEGEPKAIEYRYVYQGDHVFRTEHVASVRFEIENGKAVGFEASSSLRSVTGIRLP
jgi:hypothetical protein